MAANATASPTPALSSSVDPDNALLGPLPDLYNVTTSAISVGWLILAAVLVMMMQLG
jgi:hypothetical protein